MRRKLTAEELASLEQRARAVGELELAVLGPLLLELVLGYREHVIDFGEMKEEGSQAFLGGMLGGLAGGMLERKLREFGPRPKCEATRGGRRCSLPLGHDTPHLWGAKQPSDAKPVAPKNRKGSSR